MDCLNTLQIGSPPKNGENHKTDYKNKKFRYNGLENYQNFNQNNINNNNNNNRATNNNFIQMIYDLALYHGLKVNYNVIEEKGPQHAKIFQVECHILNTNNEIVERFQSSGTSISRAKQSVAEKVLAETKLEIPTNEQIKKKRTEIYQEKLNQNLISNNNKYNKNNSDVSVNELNGDQNTNHPENSKDPKNSYQENNNIPCLFSNNNQNQVQSPFANDNSDISNDELDKSLNNSNSTSSSQQQQSNNNQSQSLMSLMSINIDPSKLSIKYDEKNSNNNQIKHNHINNPINKNNNFNRKNGNKFDNKKIKNNDQKKPIQEQPVKKEIKPNSAAAAALAIANRSNTNQIQSNNQVAQQNSNPLPAANPALYNTNGTYPKPPPNVFQPVPPPNYNPYSMYPVPQQQQQPAQQQPGSNNAQLTSTTNNTQGATAKPVTTAPNFQSSSMTQFPGYPHNYDPYAYSNYYAQWQAQYYQQWQWASINQAYGVNQPVPQPPTSKPPQPPQPPAPPK